MSCSVIKALIFLLSIVFVSSTAAGTNTPRQHQTLDQIIKLTGMDVRIRQFPGKVQAELRTLSPDDTTRQQNILSSFSAGMLRAAFRRQLNLSQLASRYPLLLNRLNTAEIRAMLRMERAALGIVARYERPMFIKQLKTRPPTSQRLALITALDEAMGYSRLQNQSRQLLQQEIRQLIKPPASHGKNKAVPGNIEPGEHWPAMLYTYRQASDEALQAYINFYHSYQGQLFIKSFNSAWLAAIKDLARHAAWRSAANKPAQKR